MGEISEIIEIGEISCISEIAENSVIVGISEIGVISLKQLSPLDPLRRNAPQ